MVRVITTGKDEHRSCSQSRIFDDGYPSELSKDGLVIRQEKTHAVLHTFSVHAIVRVDFTPRPYA